MIITESIKNLKREIKALRNELCRVRQNSVPNELYISVFNENEQLREQVKRYKDIAQENYDRCLKLSSQLKKYTEEK